MIANDLIRPNPADELLRGVSDAMIATFCRRHQIRRLALFGSVLGTDFGPKSDVDILVDFAPDAQIGYFGMAQIEADLSKLLGHVVDLRTPAELSRYFRADVVANAKVLYDGT
jgi:hypothetical protein